MLNYEVLEKELLLFLMEEDIIVLGYNKEYDVSTIVYNDYELDRDYIVDTLLQFYTEETEEDYKTFKEFLMDNIDCIIEELDNNVQELDYYNVKSHLDVVIYL